MIEVRLDSLFNDRFIANFPENAIVSTPERSLNHLIRPISSTHSAAAAAAPVDK